MHWCSASLANMQIRWSMGRCLAPSNKIGPKTVGPSTDCSHKAPAHGRHIIEGDAYIRMTTGVHICMQTPTNRDPFSVVGSMFIIEGVEGGSSDFA